MLINLIIFFVLVLVIGIVVDNVIVVVEVVYVKMEEDLKFMFYKVIQVVFGELSGVIIVIILVMIFVFVLIVFMSGLVGVFYWQFFIIMVSFIVIFGVVVFMFMFVLCVMFLKNYYGKCKCFLFDCFIDQFNCWFE